MSPTRPNCTVPDNFFALSRTDQVLAIQNSLDKDLAGHESLQDAETVFKKAREHLDRIEIHNPTPHIPLPSMPASLKRWTVKGVDLALIQVGLPQRAKLDFTWFIAVAHHRLCARHKFSNAENSCAVAVVANLVILLDLNILEIDQFPIKFLNTVSRQHAKEGRRTNPFSWLARTGVENDDNQVKIRLEMLKNDAHKEAVRELNRTRESSKNLFSFQIGDFLPLQPIFSWAVNDVPQLNFAEMDISWCFECQSWRSIEGGAGGWETPNDEEVKIQNIVELVPELDRSIEKPEEKGTVEAMLQAHFNPRAPFRATSRSTCDKCSHLLQRLRVIGGEPPARLAVEPSINAFLPGNCAFKNIDLTFHQLDEDGKVTQMPGTTRYRVRAIVQYISSHYLFFWKLQRDRYAVFDSMNATPPEKSTKTLDQIVKNAQKNINDRRLVNSPRIPGRRKTKEEVSVALLVYERVDCFELPDTRF